MFSKFIDFFRGKNQDNLETSKKNDINNKLKPEKMVLSISKNDKNMSEIKSIVLKLAHGCICANTIEEAHSLRNKISFSKRSLIILDFDKTIIEYDLFKLRIWYRMTIIIFVDRETIEDFKNLVPFLAKLSVLGLGKYVVVRKPVSVEKMLCIITEHLDVNTTLIIKWD